MSANRYVTKKMYVLGNATMTEPWSEVTKGIEKMRNLAKLIIDEDGEADEAIIYELVPVERVKRSAVVFEPLNGDH